MVNVTAGPALICRLITGAQAGLDPVKPADRRSDAPFPGTGNRFQGGSVLRTRYEEAASGGPDKRHKGKLYVIV